MSEDRSFDHNVIIDEANRILGEINNAGLFKSEYVLRMQHVSTIESNSNTLRIVYRLDPVHTNEDEDPTTYCMAVYSKERQPTIQTYKPVLLVDVPYVTSEIRCKEGSSCGTGTFLLYVQLLLAHRVGAVVFKLNNSAGKTPANAVRALHGIYQWFNFNTRTVSRANRMLQRRIQMNKTLTNQEKNSRILQEVAGGDLYFDMEQFSYSIWLEHVSSLKMREDEPESPWVSDVKQRVTYLVPSRSSHSSSYGKVVKQKPPQNKPYSKKGGRYTMKRVKKTNKKSNKKTTSNKKK